MNIILRKTRSAFWRLLGIDKINQALREEKAKTARLREEVDTLQYFLNMLHDCIAISPTKDPDLRIMQECDAIMLQIIHKVCLKFKISYWLNFGTLLGAVRHHGFIPWDDDMDACMMRADFEKAKNVLKDVLEPLGFSVIEDHINSVYDPLSTRLGIGYKHERTGIWIDFFPYDSYIGDCSSIENMQAAITEYNTSASMPCIIKNTNGTQEYLYCCCDHILPVKKEDIFPLSEVEFEGYNYPAPANVHEVLLHSYGKNYMSFPKVGIEQHDGGRGPLKLWAKYNGVDMHIIRNELEYILSNI